MEREKVVKGIQECNLNGGLIGNCPYKGILALLEEKEAEIASLKAMQLQTVHNMSNEDIGNAVRNVLRL